MKVKNMVSSKGNVVANQFIIIDSINESNYTVYFQSYNSIIAKKVTVNGVEHVSLDYGTWNYSRTTSKYRTQFLNETTKETEKKIKDGTYQLTNLN